MKDDHHQGRKGSKSQGALLKWSPQIKGSPGGSKDVGSCNGKECVCRTNLKISKSLGKAFSDFKFEDNLKQDILLFLCNKPVRNSLTVCNKIIKFISQRTRVLHSDTKICYNPNRVSKQLSCSTT